MSREVTTALEDLGLTPTEAEIYVELVRRAGEGAVSAYKLGKGLGRDPANTTKILGALEKRGAVRLVQQKPRAYLPVPPEDFTGALVAHLSEQRDIALRLLRDLGGSREQEVVHPLLDSEQVTARAVAMLQECRTLALVDAAPAVLAMLAEELAAAAARDVAVLVKTPGGAKIPGARVWPDLLAEAAPDSTPGPWLRLVTDGEVVLTAQLDPRDSKKVLHGSWHRIPQAACLVHRGLAAELVQAATRALLAADVPPAKIAHRTDELASQLLHRVPWRERWEKRGWVAPAAIAPHEAAAAAGALADDPPAESPEEAAGPLQFIFRRKKKPS